MTPGGTSGVNERRSSISPAWDSDGWASIQRSPAASRASFTGSWTKATGVPTRTEANSSGTCSG